MNAHGKEKLRYYADKRNNAKPNNISIRDKVIVTKKAKEQYLL